MYKGIKLQESQYWMGNNKSLGWAGVFLAKKWVDKVIDISWVSDRMVVIKALVPRIIFSII